MGAIYRREMGAFFTSGIAYVFLAGFALFSGLFFVNSVIPSGVSDMSPLFSSMFIIVIFLIPILTMRLLSEEKKNRTDQGLLTAPVSLTSIVLGKYFAALTLFVIAESIVFIYSIIIAISGKVIWSTLLGNYFAMLFLGAAFIAIGLFISSLTENQIASALIAMFVLFVLFLMDSLAANITVEFIQKAIITASFYTRYLELTRGVFDLSTVFYFISIAVLFNFFSVRVLDKRRWA